MFDFDENGQTESIVAVAKEDNYYTIDSKDKLQSQMPELIRKKFNSYNDISGKTVSDIFGYSKLNKLIYI